MMTSYVLLITLYRRCYLDIEGYKEMETESSIRRKYTLSFRLFNIRVQSLFSEQNIELYI